MVGQLQLINDLILSFNDQRITYTHFKSNSRLEQTVSGLTDLDILVDRNQNRLVTETLYRLDFKKFVSPPWRNYPGIHDWLGFDRYSGRIIHLHLHYQIITGARYVKQYRLDIEDMVLAFSKKDPKTGMPIPDTSLELIIFAVRGCLKKTRTETFLKLVTGRRKNSSAIEEYNYLRKGSDKNDVQYFAEKLFGTVNASTIAEVLMSAKNPDTDLSSIQKIFMDRFAWTNRYSCFGTVFSQWRGYLSQGLHMFRLPALAGWRGKRHDTVGLTVAIVGCDGSGKTTLELLLSDWLRRHIDTKSYYLGSGDGSLPPSLNLIKLFWRVLRPKSGTRIKHRFSPKGGVAKDHRRLTYYFIGKAIFVLRLCFNRLKSVQTGTKLRNNGGISLFVRFPQIQFNGINDGPRLQELPTHVGVYMAGIERKILKKINRIGIDLVIYLDVSIDIIVDRRPEMAPIYLDEKLEKLQKVLWPSRNIFVLDGSKPIELVQMEAKCAIWESL